MFSSYPFFRYSLFLITGILFEMYFELPIACWIAGGGISGLVYVSAFTNKKLWLYQGLLMAAILVCLGGLLLKVKTHIPDVRILHADYVKATITEEPRPAKTGFKAEAVLSRFKMAGSSFACKEKVMLFMPDSLPYGSIIWIKGSLSSPSPALIPHGFDYKAYLNSKQIFFVKYFKTADYKYVSADGGNLLMHFSIGLRAHLVEKIKRFVKGENESAIASAMVLGVKGDWDESLRNDYAKSGTLHILAVSGMHVGLLYTSLLWLLGPLRKRSAGRWFSALIVISCLILYGIITGMSASVVRAVVMCILLEIAAVFDKRPSLMNTVFLSAFVLLCLDPYLLIDTGFQLSYAALVGIVVWQSYWAELVHTKYTFVNTIWSVFSTTLAAQLAVAPLGLLYFHQFPNLFWLSNIVVIPLSIGILYAGITLICISSFGSLAALLGGAISLFIKWVNQFIGLVANLPFSVTNDIYIGWLSVIGCYLVLLWFTQAFLYRQKRKLWLTIAMVAGLALFESAELLHKLDVKVAGVSYQDKNTGLYFQNGIYQSYMCQGDSVNRFWQFEGKNIIHLTDWKPTMKSVNTDILVVDLKFCKNAEAIITGFSPKQLVITPVVSFKLQEEMKQLAKQKSILYHVMREQGYFEMKVK